MIKNIKNKINLKQSIKSIKIYIRTKIMIINQKKNKTIITKETQFKIKLQEHQETPSIHLIIIWINNKNYVWIQQLSGYLMT